ncbi:MAG: hypothetical protein WA749_10010 [Gelidibacter sp.]
MGRLKQLLGVMGIILLLRCVNNKKSTNTNQQPGNVSRIESYSLPGDSIDNGGNKVDSLDNDSRMYTMFADLNFTGDEIDSYRNMAKKERDNWREQNANIQLDEKARLQLEEETMRKFLNEKHFEQYQEWLKSNTINH